MDGAGHAYAWGAKAAKNLGVSSEEWQRVWAATAQEENAEREQTLAEVMELVDEYGTVYAGYCCGPINRDEPERLYAAIEQRLRQVLDSQA